MFRHVDQWERSFDEYPLVDGCLAELLNCQETFGVFGWRKESLTLPGDSTHFGFVLDGVASLACASGEFMLNAGMYFCVPTGCSIEGGRGFVVSQPAYRGFFQVGGPIESEGRLHYIDGCSDSLLIPPLLLGDACLNLLHIPPGTDQTSHTHPSFRVGIVVRGHGLCRTAEDVTELKPEVVFAIQQDALHSFHTTNESLTVVAFHPDSDFGPTHGDHPMLNRTELNGRESRV